MIRTTIIFYLLILHLIAGAFVLHSISPIKQIDRLTAQLKPQRLPPAYRRMHYHFIQQSQQLAKHNIVFIGDSLTHSYNVSNAFPYAVNFGISGDTISGVSDRLSRYSRLAVIDSLVIMIGINDIVHENLELQETSEAIDRLASRLPKTPTIYWRAILPIAQPRDAAKYSTIITKVNAYMQRSCATLGNCRWVKPPDKMLTEKGLLSRKYHNGDGLHLNRYAYTLLSESLMAYINETNSINR